MADHPNDTGPITLINVFEIHADEIDRFLQEWRERAQFLSSQPGFRSLRLHRALNPEARFQLVNVAEWNSAEDLKAATEQDFFTQSTRLSMRETAVTAHPATYRVVVEATAEER
jgi:heme oxygenase (mycobilin-producing)